MDPLPFWVDWFALADVLNIGVPDLGAVEPYLMVAAKTMLAARQQVREHEDAERARAAMGGRR